MGEIYLSTPGGIAITFVEKQLRIYQGQIPLIAEVKVGEQNATNGVKISKASG